MDSSSQTQFTQAITVPVIFHVVWRTQAERLSFNQLQSQIDVLNEDFNRLNPDSSQTPSAFASIAGKMDIHFCLARRDPLGQSTEGVEYHNTDKQTFMMNQDEVKSPSLGGVAAWPAGQYLNIWICNLEFGSIAGYATAPGGVDSLDGVVLDYRFTGRGGTALPPGNLGRTGTHEVGHWLDLRHIWAVNGCGTDDGIADTPLQDRSSQGCPNFPHFSCTGQPHGDMFMNYMDYTHDACMNMFSQQQLAVAQAQFQAGGGRANFMGAWGCLAVSRNPYNSPMHISVIEPGPQLWVENLDSGPYQEAQLIDMNGRIIDSISLVEHSPQHQLSYSLAHFSPGIYVIRIIGGQLIVQQKILIRH